VIGIVSVAEDVHYRCVAEELRRMGFDSALIEIPKLGSEGRLSLATGSRNRVTWSVPGGAQVDLTELDCIWYRRYFPPVLTPAPAARADTDWALREWRDAVASAFAVAGTRFVSNPAAQEQAELKPYQLRIAQEVGLRVPDTLMTNDADEARAFIQRHGGQVVHKVVKTPRDRFIGTKTWSAEDASELQWLYLSPTFFQERVAAPHELRITVVGPRIFAAQFAVAPDITDARLELHVPYEEHRLPPHVEGRLRRLMDRLGLEYGTIDMKRNADGEYVFLEVNPQGQYLYVEIKTGMPITRAVAELLAGTAAEGTLSRPRDVAGLALS
jgi:glutathione synthase/RimK-type ligase-like ATP-grasp enzyme